MNMETREEGGVLYVRPGCRRIDLSVAPELKARLHEFIHAGHRRLALNLADVEFLDSSGLAALISAIKQIGAGGGVALYGAKDTVLGLLRLTRMDSVFAIVADEKEARESLAR